jgi:hypothetical protein
MTPIYAPLRTPSTKHPAGVLAAAAIIAFLSPPRTACADWQYTKWGMSPEEVVTASNADAHLVPDAQAKKELGDPRSYFVTLASGTRSIDGERFSVLFGFGIHSKRLQIVTLRAADTSRCFIYRAALLDKYGAPALSEDNGTHLIWRDLPSGNAVSWVLSLCTISIEPIDSDFINSMWGRGG